MVHAGPWQHGACHLTPAIVHGDESRQVDAWGGWHDAGDYGKYVVPGAKAVVDLFAGFRVLPGGVRAEAATAGKRRSHAGCAS